MTTTIEMPATELEIAVGPLGEDDLPAADRVFRLAFGTMMGLPDPLRFAAGAELVRSRWLADPAAAFKAEVDGELVGSAFVTRWGSFVIFGPLSVHPNYWDRGVGRRLWDVRLPLLERWGATHAVLFTRPDSTKHLHLYQKFGFWPRFLTALAAKPVPPASERSLETYSALSQTDRDEVVRECRALTDAIYPGLDLEREIRAVTDQAIGDVVLVHDAEALAGFAVCQTGEGSEAGPGACGVKFAAARPGAGAQARLERVLDACEAFAAARGLSRLVTGVNVGREEAYRTLLACGYRTFHLGLAMHRPNEPGYNRPGAYVIDDWR